MKLLVVTIAKIFRPFASQLRLIKIPHPKPCEWSPDLRNG